MLSDSLHSKVIIMRKIFSIVAAIFLLILCADGASSCKPREETPGKGRAAVYLYLCGSSLETKSGAATQNLSEILSAKLPENTDVVIETGGAKKWRGHGIAADVLTRYAVQGGTLKVLQRLPNASMGSGETFSEFIGFCLENYPAEKTALILWDHGGGSTGEICFDENFGMSSLNLEEIGNALKARNARFDMMGFDACLMATMETAAFAANYSEYLLASEEIEPAGGWDYTAFLEAFSVGKETEEIGKTVCDAYMAKCIRAGKGSSATLSLFDLSHYGEFADAFDSFSAGLLSAVDGDGLENFHIVNATQQTSKFGANGYEEGSSNLIDLYGFAKALAGFNERAEELLFGIEKLISYNVNGTGRSGCGGVSLYFPLKYDKAELERYLTLCPSENYKKYFGRIYSDIPEETIAFSDRGSAEGGVFQISLTEESRKYIKSVEFTLLQSEGEGDERTTKCMGVDNDAEADWESLTFCSNFRGTWLSLGNVYLYYNVLESNECHIIFSAPVLVNGERSNLRFMFVWDEGAFNGGKYEVIGLWDGLDQNDLAEKGIRPLKEGDWITVLTRESETAQADGEFELIEGETVTIGADGGEIKELPVSGNEFEYMFLVTDIFGNRFYSNKALLRMKYSFEELLDNPLPDGVPAADVLEILP